MQHLLTYRICFNSFFSKLLMCAINLRAACKTGRLLFQNTKNLYMEFQSFVIAFFLIIMEVIYSFLERYIDKYFIVLYIPQVPVIFTVSLIAYFLHAFACFHIIKSRLDYGHISNKGRISKCSAY